MFPSRREDVSVPLRGLWFLSGRLSYGKQEKTNRFPSPYGDYGSYQHVTHYIVEGGPFDVSVPLRGLWFLSGQLVGYSKLIHQFPSPYGDYGSYPRQLLPLLKSIGIVSVPLRGLWFLSKTVEEAPPMAIRFVSVPLRGLWFLSTPQTMDKEGLYKFPSPYGDYGSYRLNVSKT